MSGKQHCVSAEHRAQHDLRVCHGAGEPDQQLRQAGHHAGDGGAGQVCQAARAWGTWDGLCAFGILCVPLPLCDCLVGLVVRRPPRERKVPGSNPACAGIFGGSSHASDLNIGTPVATLPGVWCYRVSTGTGRPGVSVLWLGEVERLICNFCLSVAARKLSEQIRPWDTLACCWDIKQPTNKQTNCPSAEVHCRVMCSMCTSACHQCLFVGCLASQQHASVSQGPILLRQFYMLPHRDRSCRSNFLSHPITVYWHHANQSQSWPNNAGPGRVATGMPVLSHWYDSTRKNPIESGIWTWDLPLPKRMP